MKIGFSQTAVHRITCPIHEDFPDSLPEALQRDTGWNYACTQNTTGYLLKPTFHNMLRRNSFVPEIAIVISQDNGQTSLHMQGRPVKFVRIFMKFWFGFLLLMEIFLLAMAVTSRLENLFPMFIPIIMCILGYALCAIGTKVSFQAVVKAIRKAFP